MYDPYRQQQNQGYPQPGQPQLFEDTSGSSAGNYNHQASYSYGSANQYGSQPPNYPNAYAPGYPMGVPGSQFIQDPMVQNMAMQYGQNLVGQGKEFVDAKLEKLVSVSKVKYYFAVDTKYVLNKLRLIFMPFTHSDWSVKYTNESEEPLQPRFDVNAPDLYIPVMAVVTYILMAGLSLGLKNSFSPDVLGLHATWAVFWLIFEVGVIMVCLHILSIQTKMQTLHILALSAYKYPGMIVSITLGILLDRFAYYCAVAYTGIACLVFMFRAFRSQIQGDHSAVHGYSAGNKRRFYLLLLISGLQPFMMWLLTTQLALSRTVSPES